MLHRTRHRRSKDELEDITLETIQEEPEDVIENVTQLEGNQRNAQETDTTCEGDKGTDTLAEGVRTENALCKSSEIKKDADKKSSGNTKGILLDVRSDIYCLGATLYHLISGQRPAQDAREVVPLGPDICSKTVSEILPKSDWRLSRMTATRRRLKCWKLLKRSMCVTTGQCGTESVCFDGSSAHGDCFYQADAVPSSD